MLPSQPPDSGLARAQRVTRALWLVSVSVAFGLVSGAVSVITGLHGHSLGVFAVGLGVLADVTGSATLIWRFEAERRRPGQSAAYERRGAVIVAITLAVVAVVLTAESVRALASGSRPGTSAITLRTRLPGLLSHLPVASLRSRSVTGH
jgi:divalent metal cation (Fe/Co/Zn/Cd) transporter